MPERNLNNSNSIDTKRIQDSLSRMSRNKSIRQWDLGASSSNDMSVQVDKGEPKQLKASQRSSITIRVWNKKGLVGITSTSDLSNPGLSKAFEGAYDASQYGNANEIPDFSPLSKDPLPEIIKPLREFIGIKKLLELLKTAESKLLNKHHSIQNVPYNGLAESRFERIYINSEGSDRFFTATQATLYLYARAEEAGRKPRSAGAIRLAHGVNEIDIEACINEAASRTISHLNYQPIETNKYLVCFTPEAFLELIGAFSSMFNARSVIDGVSLSSIESIGNQIAVPFLTLYDDAIHPSNFHSTTFDGEGTPTKPLCLINRGKLDNFLHSEATAREFGVKPTGHAGLGAKVSVGPDWLVVKRSQSEYNQNDSLKHDKYNDKFILIEGLNALHAGVKASQGSFSLPFDGWLVNQGNKTSIEAATVAGDIRKVLKQIVDIEYEQLITHQGISPYVWVEGLSITGEE